MGLFKKIKKAVSKVVKQVSKPVENVVKGAAGLVTGGAGETQVIQQEAAPAPQVVAAPAPATQVETPNVVTDDEDSASTESDLKKNRSAGKKALSVARSAGSGINI